MIIIVPVCTDELTESLGWWIFLFSTRLFNVIVHILSLSQHLLGMSDGANSLQVVFGFLWS